MVDRTKGLSIVVCALFLAGGGLAEAAFITPTNAWSSSYWSANGCSPSKLINSAGLSANSPAGTHDNHSLASTMWMAGPTDGGLGGPTGNPPNVASQEVVFDLGATHNLAQAHIWQMNQGHAVNAGGVRNTRTMDIYVSPDNVTYTQVGGTRTLGFADGSSSALPAETVSLSAGNVRYVKFDILTPGGYFTPGNQYVGLSEVRFQSVPTGVVFSEDFEGTGLADGTFTSGSWGPQFTGGSNLLNPAATGPTAAWLNPVPPLLGEIFGTLQAGGTATANLTDAFVDNTTYTLSFTHFKRDDLVGDAVTARIIDANTGSILASNVFPALTTDDTFLTRTLSYTTSGGFELGHAIRLQFYDANGGNNYQQAGIDNISLSAATVAVIPEPATMCALGLAVLGLGGYVRKRRRG